LSVLNVGIGIRPMGNHIGVAMAAPLPKGSVVMANLDERGPVVEQCKTADMSYAPDPKDKEKKIGTKVPCRKIDGDLCSVYRYPFRRWAVHACPMAAREIIEEVEKMVNPLKASKRGGK